MTPKIALCIGHSRFIKGRRDGGSVSVGGVSEWSWNCDLATRVMQDLRLMGIESTIISVYQGSGYEGAMSALASRLRELGVRAAIEFHFNCADASARGHEWLHWCASPNGLRLAALLDAGMDAMFPEIPSRGLKARIKPRNASEAEDNRGWQFLAYTHCPAVIAEPFFGSNVKDWTTANERKDDLAKVYADAINHYFKQD